MSNNPYLAQDATAASIKALSGVANGATVNIRLDGGALVTGTLQSNPNTTNGAFVVRDTSLVNWTLHPANVVAVGV